MPLTMPLHVYRHCSDPVLGGEDGPCRSPGRVREQIFRRAGLREGMLQRSLHKGTDAAHQAGDFIVPLVRLRLMIG